MPDPIHIREKLAERKERTFIKISLAMILGLVLLVGGIWAGHDALMRWQERRLLRRAWTALEQGNGRDASVAARTVLQANPGSPGAARVMARLTEQERDRSAMDWRRKVVEAPAHTNEDILDWARAALLFGDTATAERALDRLDEAGKQTAGYQAVEGLLAQVKGDEEKADQAWSEAVRLLPNEKTYQLHLGLLRLSSSDAARHAAGAALLEQLRDSPGQRSVATRALIKDAAARHYAARQILELAHDLQSYPEATLTDRLIYLDCLHQVQAPQFSSYLTELEKATADNPAALTQLLSWMSTKNLSLVALDFARSLPPATLEEWPVPLGLAEIYGHLQDWDDLEALTKNAHWKKSEFLRHAYLTLVHRGKDRAALAEHEWAAAVKEASPDSGAVLSLVQLALEWKWTAEAVDLFWTLSKLPEKESEALASLYKHYSKTHDTQGLYRVMTRLAELEPNNLDFKNNVAQIGLLLNAQPEEARRFAAEVYQKAPTNAAYATTYAYSLLRQRNAEGAVEVMDKLTPEQLRDPAVGTYYGICLAATRDQRAHDFLALATRAALLPEERAEVTKAEKALR